MTDEAIPVGEEGLVSKMPEYNGDPLAIAHGEKPVFDVQLATWTQDGEPLSVEESKQKVRLVLAKNKKFFERGIMQLIINGRTPVNINVDALISCVYSVYDIPNPYKNYDPNKPTIKAFGVVKEETIPETTEVPEHTKRELLAITLDETELLVLSEKHEGSKPIDMILSIEESSEVKS